MKTIQEQVADLKATRETKNEQLRKIAQKSIDEGRSMDTAEAEQFDTLVSEIKRLDDDIARLSRLSDEDKNTAKPVVQESQPAQRGSSVNVKSTETLEPGIGFARIARVKALAKMSGQAPLEIAMNAYPKDGVLHEHFAKAAVPAASASAATWAGNLILDGGAYFADFVEYLRKRTVLGQIAGRLRPLPFDTQVLVQGSAGSAKWVGEGAAKPLTQWTYTRTKLEPLKVAAIAAATKETLMRASVSADALIRDELVRSVGAAIDTKFVSTDAASSGVSPAGIRNGISETPTTGDGSVEGIKCDIGDMMKAIVSANNTVAGAFWLMPETTAIDLSLAINAFGAPAFPGMTPTGGTLAGLPAFASQYLPVQSAGATVILARGDDIFLGDEGGVQVSMSDQASLVMDDSPSMNSVTSPTAAQMVSMFQTNSVAFLVERFVNWQRRQAGSVVWSNVDWNAC